MPEVDFAMSAVPLAAKASGAEQLAGLVVAPAVVQLESLTERAPELADA